MIRYNESTKNWGHNNCIYGIVYVDKNYIEFGWFICSQDSFFLQYNHNIWGVINAECCHIPLFWDNAQGVYTFTKRNSNVIKKESKYIFHYPIKRAYNLCKVGFIPTKFSPQDEDKRLLALKPYTFGLEFETSAGNIPWLELLKNNLIPLYDGSITGHEYVTLPLNISNLSLVEEHLKLLKKYTLYDKDCSLHIHFGGFPVDLCKIDNLIKGWYYFQHILLNYIPQYSYSVEKYKSNRKAYNKLFPNISIKEFYQATTGNLFELDNNILFKRNQFDANEEKKWQVSGRYYNMNIMHLISGEQHKTIEFRFIKPTYYYSEILWYIQVLGGFLKFIEQQQLVNYRDLSLCNIINTIYPNEIASKILEQGNLMYRLHKIQINWQDLAGLNDTLKDLYLHKLNNF